MVCLNPTLWGTDFCCICFPPHTYTLPWLSQAVLFLSMETERSGIDGRTQRWPRPGSRQKTEKECTRRSLGHLFTSSQIFPVQTPGPRAPLEVWGTLKLQIPITYFQVTGQMLLSMEALTPRDHTWERMTLGQHLLPPSSPLP